MKEYTSNSEKISENHIAGINRVVKLYVVVNGKPISHFKRFRLQQSARRHHQFELTLAHDSLDEIQNYNLEQAKRFLGKRLTVTFKYKDPEHESPERTFVGVVTNVGFSQEEMSLGNIVLKGYSPTILMDSAPHTQSFGGSDSVNTAIIANDIIKEALGTNDFDFRIDAQYQGYINYSSQYCETHYNYLARLAEAYGEQFYYDGKILHFGKLPAHEKRIQLTDKSNVSNVRVELEAIHTKPEFFGYNSSSHTQMLGSTNPIKHLGDLSSQAYELNNGIFKTRSLIPTPINPNMFKDVDDSQKSAMGSAAVEVMTVLGNTSIPFLYIGCVADIAMRKPDTNKSEHFTTLMITEANHEVDARGYYTGSFEGIAEGTGFMPKPDFVIPKAEQQVATVISNVDPLNQGRIQVRFDWQGKSDSTYFIRMMSPDAGGTGVITQNRGFVSIPEIGDQVMVGFEYNNPDFPFAMGGMFHGGIGLGGGVDNHLKSIQTRSGIKVLMNDAEKSVTIEDPSGNVYFMDGQGNINVTAPNKIIMNATDIQMNAYNNLEMNVSNNVIINAMSKFFVFTPYMKQVVSGFMSFFSGKALFNSSGTLDIEAKEAKLHGIDKTTVHSDKQAIINSKGTAEMYGESGNQLGNKAENRKTTASEDISLAIVHFRTKETGYNGEFGFDWLRLKDNGLTVEPEYATIIESGYKDGTTDLSKADSKTNLYNEYFEIPIKRKTPIPDEKYYVSYLTLFPKDFVDKMPKTSTKPQYEAELRILLEIEDDIDKLEFDYDKTLFTIDKPMLKDKTKTTGLIKSSDITVKITCNKDITTAEKGEIKIYAYPKGSIAKSEAEQKTLRKLAGKILVEKNDAIARKELKMVLVKVATNVSGKKNKKVGKFATQEVNNLFNTMHQSLIIPKIENVILDLTKDKNFQMGGKYIDPSGLIIDNVTDDPALKNQGTHIYLKSKFDAESANKMYSGYFVAFSFGVDTYFPGGMGIIQKRGIKNLLLTVKRDNYTLNHEGLHGLNLCHTFRDEMPIKEIERKYIYNSDSATNNVMSYSPTSNISWKWQWAEVRKHV